MSGKSRSRGMSLIEVVVFIVVFGIGIAGVVTLYSQLTKASVDPVVRKQALAIAASLMEEIQLRGFTYCDPDDPNVYTAPSTPCTTAEAIGPEAGETRYAVPRFDNVNDYHGFSMSGASIHDVTDTQIPGMNGYSVSVSVAEASADFPAGLNAVLANEALRITVSVTGPAGVSVSLQGYRLRYAPNSP